MKINDIMTKGVIKVNAESSIQDVAKVLKDHNIGSVPVCREDKVVGIITDRDIVIRAIAEGNTSLNASDVMTSNPVTCSSNSDVEEVSRIMSERQIRRIPIVDNSNLVGMVALGDLAVENISDSEVGEALKEISTPCCPD
jgi:CBS domain-containing protein